MERVSKTCALKLTYGRRDDRLHHHPASCGRGRVDGTILNCGCFGPYHTPVRPPGSAEADQAPVERWKSNLRSGGYTVFMAAPSITTPLVTYFHRATSSFRASATIVTFLARGPSRRTRSWNHRASAEAG